MRDFPWFNFFDLKIIKTSSVSGGFISKAYKVELEDGRTYFLKTGQGRENFEKEAKGLQYLSPYFKTPEVYGVFEDCLILTFEEKHSAQKDSYKKFGTQLAKMHKNSQKHRGLPGLEFDNTIGASPQLNVNDCFHWPDFFWHFRLKPQFEWAQKRSFSFSESVLKMVKEKNYLLLERVEESCTSLIHGDLWGGNHAFNINGDPWLFDPACYFGHREAEIAMMKLFAGFPSEQFMAYEKEYPLVEGHKERLPLYQLYHIFNHVNLFGGSYYQQAKKLINCLESS